MYLTTDLATSPATSGTMGRPSLRSVDNVSEAVAVLPAAASDVRARPASCKSIVRGPETQMRRESPLSVGPRPPDECCQVSAPRSSAPDGD
jgi:hypothetical protein